MQVLKEEMRQRIYEAAIGEFNKKGFKNASMREIAGKAGMTVGNLYRYFKDKEALFYCVISPAYESLMELVGVSLDQVRRQFDRSFFGILAEHILKISKEHRIELLILFEGSAGTRYEKAREEVVQIVEDFLRESFAGKHQEQDIETVDTYLFRVIAVGFVDGMTMIARKYESDGKLKKVAEQYIAFYFSNLFGRLL